MIGCSITGSGVGKLGNLQVGGDDRIERVGLVNGDASAGGHADGMSIHIVLDGLFSRKNSRGGRGRKCRSAEGIATLLDRRRIIAENDLIGGERIASDGGNRRSLDGSQVNRLADGLVSIVSDGAVHQSENERVVGESGACEKRGEVGSDHITLSSEIDSLVNSKSACHSFVSFFFVFWIVEFTTRLTFWFRHPLWMQRYLKNEILPVGFQTSS